MANDRYLKVVDDIVELLNEQEPFWNFWEGDESALADVAVAEVDLVHRGGYRDAPKPVAVEPRRPWWRFW